MGLGPAKSTILPRAKLGQLGKALPRERGSPVLDANLLEGEKAALGKFQGPRRAQQFQFPWIEDGSRPRGIHDRASAHAPALWRHASHRRWMPGTCQNDAKEEVFRSFDSKVGPPRPCLCHRRGSRAALGPFGGRLMTLMTRLKASPTVLCLVGVLGICPCKKQAALRSAAWGPELQ